MWSNERRRFTFRLRTSGPITGFKLRTSGPVTGVRLRTSGPVTGFKLRTSGPVTGVRLRTSGPVTGLSSVCVGEDHLTEVWHSHCGMVLLVCEQRIDIYWAKISHLYLPCGTTTEIWWKKRKTTRILVQSCLLLGWNVCLLHDTLFHIKILCGFTEVWIL